MKICFVAAFAVWLPLSLPAQQPSIEKLAEGELPSLLAIYKDIHSHPELSGKEERTSALVAKELRAAGCEVTENFGKYDKPNLKCHGVVGVMKNGSGPTVLVRTDMDALPVEEQTGAPYASKVTSTNVDGKEVPVMHACGHDIHMSAFIGTARTLQKLKNQWAGTIIFIGQPSEEMLGGARALMNGGLYNRFGKPNYALALHDDADLEAGKIGVTEGYCQANVDSVDVTVKGVGGHGAYPHKTKDPVVLAAEMINAWQTIASRENNPLDPVVVTVGSIHGGTKHNIISDEVKMQLTVRTYKADVREHALAAIARIAKGCATAAGLPPDRMPDVNVLKDEHVPSTYNNPDLTKRLTAALKSAIGNDNVVPKDPTMGGEDFSEYSLADHSIPAFMFNVGAVEPAKYAEAKKTGTPLPSLHSSKFLPLPEPTIRTGIVGMTTAVLELMKPQ
ncbi:MAG TPA: amidohydrolase [Chthoniobacterales bacterium]|nr:amidohydrolase [Chthoniobacterales bacterium]